MLNTLGIENLHNATVAELKKTIEQERVRAAEELKKAKAEFMANEKAQAEKAKAVAEAKSKNDKPKTTAAEGAKAEVKRIPIPRTATELPVRNVSGNKK